MHNQDDRAHRRDERCKEARQRQEVAGRVDGRGKSKHPRHKENKSGGDSGKDRQVCVEKSKNVCADQGGRSWLAFGKHNRIQQLICTFLQQQFTGSVWLKYAGAAEKLHMYHNDRK